jgi:hypothetical protein
MLTYQDLQAVGSDERKRIEFVLTVVNEHMNSRMYREAQDAQEYMAQRNIGIRLAVKKIYSMSGKAVTDDIGSNFKMASAFAKRLIMHLANYLLGNGITMDPAAKKRLGRRFDKRLLELGKYALVDGVSFGFWNSNHVEAFRLTEFAPIWDGQTGALMSGVRFFQIDRDKPMTITLFEPDGYTEYSVTDVSNASVVQGKRAYKHRVRTSIADGEEVVAWSNYATFPIVPYWGNSEHQSEVTPMRADIDVYDLIKNGFANSINDIPAVYWTIYGADGFDDAGLAKFIDNIRKIGGAQVNEKGVNVNANTIDVPNQSRDSILDRIERDIYRNFMMLDTNSIASGADTATEVEAAYEPTNVKADDFESCTDEFVDGILDLAGMEDEDYTFQRSMVVNVLEVAQVLSIGQSNLSSEYITSKLLSLLGDGDKTESVMEQMAAEEVTRMAGDDEEDEIEDQEG